MSDPARFADAAAQSMDLKFPPGRRDPPVEAQLKSQKFDDPMQEDWPSRIYPMKLA